MTAPTTADPAASATGPGTAGTPRPGGGGPGRRRLPDRVAALRSRGAAGAADGSGGSGQAAAGPGPAAGSDRADEVLRDRLCPPMPTDRVLGWAAALAVTVVAGLLRFWQLTEPKGIYFDEVYYTKDAWGLMTAGYEVDSNTCSGPAFVVHPPLGKWFIAASEKVFGYIDCAGVPHGSPELGWRFASAFFGTLAVLVLTRLARRMFRSTLLGCVAGLLLALDGLAFVQSRIGILDIFLMTGLVLALACLVLDRDHGRARLAARLAADGAAPDERAARYGPRLGWRPWRIAAGLCLGASMGVKWSALYTLVGFAALALAWDIGARRTAGAAMPGRGALRRDAPAWVGCYVLLPIVTFLATWTGWFATDGGWRRHEHGDGFVAAWRGWWSYQQAILNFHEHLSSPHVAQSMPMSWLVMGRPVAYDYEGVPFGQQGCQAAEGCAREVLALGNPAVWWVGSAAMAAMIALWVSRRDWRAALVLVGFGSSFLPWLAFPDRTMFFFYALPLLPFLILGITMSAGLVLGPRTASDTRRLAGAVAVGSYLIVAILLFAYFYPLLAWQVIPLNDWRDRMWFPSWIVA